MNAREQQRHVYRLVKWRGLRRHIQIASPSPRRALRSRLVPWGEIAELFFMQLASSDPELAMKLVRLVTRGRRLTSAPLVSP